MSEKCQERTFCAFHIVTIRVVRPLSGKEWWFKIDYYAQDMEHASKDPADPAKTKRVMTEGWRWIGDSGGPLDGGLFF